MKEVGIEFDEKKRREGEQLLFKVDRGWESLLLLRLRGWGNGGSELYRWEVKESLSTEF